MNVKNVRVFIGGEELIGVEGVTLEFAPPPQEKEENKMGIFSLKPTFQTFDEWIASLPVGATIQKLDSGMLYCKQVSEFYWFGDLAESKKPQSNPEDSTVSAYEFEEGR